MSSSGRLICIILFSVLFEEYVKPVMQDNCFMKGYLDTRVLDIVLCAQHNDGYHLTRITLRSLNIGLKNFFFINVQVSLTYELVINCITAKNTINIV